MKNVDQQRRDYALHRMGLAIQRLLDNEAKEEKARAVRWLSAWKAMYEGGLWRTAADRPLTAPF